MSQTNNPELCQYLNKSGRCDYSIKSYNDRPNCLSSGQCRPAVIKLWQSNSTEASGLLSQTLQEIAAEQQNNCQKYKPAEGKFDNFYGIYQSLFSQSTPISRSEITAYKFIRLTSLPPGKTIFIDNVKGIKGFDVYANRLEEEVIENANQLGKSNYGLLNAGNLSNFVENYFKKQRFNGTYDNLRVIILPPDETIIRSGDRQRIVPKSVHSFMTLVDLHSTGRPNFGSLVVESSLYGKNTIGRLRGFDYYLSRAHKVIKDNEGLSAIERLMESSRQNEWLSQVEALRNMCSGGLMSLGRRR